MSPPIHAESQYLIKISTLPAYLWQSITEPGYSRSEVEVADPAKGVKRSHLTFEKMKNVTATKLYDPVTDSSIYDWELAQRTSPSPFTLTYVPVLADRGGTLYPQGKPISLLNCQVVELSLPKADRDSNNASKITLIINYEEIRMS